MSDTTTEPRPITATEVAAFLRAHLPMVKDWPDEKLRPWVNWFLRRDRALVLCDEQDQVCAVALGRFVRSTEGVADRHLFDEPEGRIVWIDAIATNCAAAMPQLVALLPEKYGDRDAVAGLVFSRMGELRMFPMNKLQRFFGG